MLNKYKEILFGVGLGAAMWLMDAAMHAELGDSIHSHGFWAELFEPNPTALVYRLVYFVIAIAFGVYLWRANWRERELRAFEAAVIAFQRQLDSPTLRILTRARQLQQRNSVQLDETARELAREIGADARLLDELAQKYQGFSEQVRSGNTAEAADSLRAIETWLSRQNTKAKS